MRRSREKKKKKEEEAEEKKRKGKKKEKNRRRESSIYQIQCKKYIKNSTDFCTPYFTIMHAVFSP